MVAIHSSIIDKYKRRDFDRIHGFNTYDYGALLYAPARITWDSNGNIREMNESTKTAIVCIDYEMTTNATTSGNNTTIAIHNNTSLFRTVSNVQNLVGVHEYINHFKKQLHHTEPNDNLKLFNSVMSHPSWKKTTSDYKEHVINERNYYLK